MVGTPRMMSAVNAASWSSTTSGLNRLTRTIRQPACKHPSVTMPQPEVWNMGMMLTHVVSLVAPHRVA